MMMHVVVEEEDEYFVGVVVAVQCSMCLLQPPRSLFMCVGCYLVYTRELFEVVCHIKV